MPDSLSYEEELEIRRRERFPSIWQALLVLAVLFCQQIIAGIALAGLLMVMRSNGIGGKAIEALGYGVVALVTFASVILGVWRWMHIPFRRLFPLQLVSWKWYPPLLITLTGLAILNSELDNMVRMLAPMPQWLWEVFAGIMGGGLMGLVLVGIVAPLTEEFLFRGILLRGFSKRYSVNRAVLLSAVFFTLFHLNPYQFGSAFCTGLVIGYIYIWTQSLIPCILAHAYYNVHGVLLAMIPGFEIRGYNVGTETNTTVLQPFWFDLIGALFLIVGLLWLFSCQKQEPDSLSSNQST